MVLKDADTLEARLGYRFGCPELLEQALTHRSAVTDAQACAPLADNERLEFLGDAVLQLVTSEALLHTFPQWSEGQLSRSRSRFVNAESLEGAARSLGLGEYFRLGKGEEKTGGRGKPGLLTDAFEAVVAAIYLDGGLGPARRFLERVLLGRIAEAGADQLAASDRKSALQEFLQARGKPPAEYRIAAETGPDHRKTFEVEVWAAGVRLAASGGSTKKEAEQRAARAALEILEAAEGKG